MSSVSTVTKPQVTAEGSSRDGGPQHSSSTPSLGDAIIKGYGQTGFIATLRKLIKQGGPDGIHRLWSAVGDVLDSKTEQRWQIATAVIGEILEAHSRERINPKIAPSPDVVARLMRCKPEKAIQLLESYWNQFAVRPVDVLTTKQFLQPDRGDFLARYLNHNYLELIKDQANYEGLGRICSHIAVQKTPAALWLCDFLRQRHARSSKEVHHQARQEAQFLVKVRDTITTRLMESPLASERNFKLTLLFPREFPHPCLDCPVQPFSREENWIFTYPHWLEGVFGAGAAAAFERRELSSNDFMLPPKDEWSDVSSGSLSIVENPPRTFVNDADRERFQQGYLRAELRRLSDAVTAWTDGNSTVLEVNDQLRQLVAAHPYALAEAIRSCRKMDPYFINVLGAVFDEKLRAAEVEPDPYRRSEAVCQAVVLKTCIRKGYEDFVSRSTAEFEHALENAGERELESAKVQAIFSTLKYLFVVTPKIEEASIKLLHRFPNTFGGSLVARYLSTVRCSDSSVRDLIFLQAGRTDVPSMQWLNYAHAAIQFVRDPAELESIRLAFKRSHEDFVGEWAEANAQPYTSLRTVRMALFPTRKDELRTLYANNTGLLESRTESTIKRVLNRALPDLLESGGVPGAPAIDAAMRVAGYQGQPLLLFVDGEPFHAVNRRWSERGFDGHTCSVTWNFTHAGYPVLRIPNSFGDKAKHGDLIQAVQAVQRILLGESPEHPHLVEVDPPHDFKPDGSKVILYTAR
jgi:hypothetical protein